MEKTHVIDAHAVPNTSRANDQFIDLCNPEEAPPLMTMENCPHSFTIIGYVSAMRRRNPEASNPFPGVALPPLPVQNRPRYCFLCRGNDGASTSATAPTRHNISTISNEASGDDSVVPLETPELPINGERVPADAEMVQAPVIDINVINNGAADINTNGDVRDVQEIATNMDVGVMHLDGNGTNDDDDDDDMTLSEIRARTLRRLPRVAAERSDPNEVAIPERVVESVPPVRVEEMRMSRDDRNPEQESSNTTSSRVAAATSVLNEVANPERVVESVVEVVEIRNDAMSSDDRNPEQESSDTTSSSDRLIRKRRFVADLFVDAASSSDHRLRKMRFVADLFVDDAASLPNHGQVLDVAAASVSSTQQEPAGEAGSNEASAGAFPRRNEASTNSTQQEPAGEAGSNEAAAEPSSQRHEASTNTTQPEPAGEAGSNEAAVGPSSRRNGASTSRGQASASTSSGLDRRNMADRLKRKAEKSPAAALLTKKNKSNGQLRICEPNLGRISLSSSSTMSASGSFRSPSEVAGPSNVYSNEHQSFRETGIINTNDPQGESQIPVSSRVINLNENIRPQSFEQNIVRRTQLLDLNEIYPTQNESVQEHVNERPSSYNMDEAPMNIVDVMVRNQHERNASNTQRPSLGPHTHVDDIRRLLDLHDLRNTERRHLVGSSGLNGISFQIPRDIGMNIPTSRGNGAGTNHFTTENSIYQLPRQYSSFPPTPSVIPFSPNSVPQPPRPEASRPRGTTISDIRANELRNTREARPTVPFRLNNEFCSINRNPAEFSTPDDRNEYTIHGDQIRPRNSRSHSRG